MWYFWSCSVGTPHGWDELAVMWQIADPKDAPVADVTARYKRGGKRVNECCIDQPLKARPRDVERLFTEPYATLLSPGAASAGCRPSPTDTTGLGSLWHCRLETDSDGTHHEVVRIRADGSFTSTYSGRGCCIKTRLAGSRAQADLGR